MKLRLQFSQLQIQNLILLHSHQFNLVASLQCYLLSQLLPNINNVFYFGKKPHKCNEIPHLKTLPFVSDSVQTASFL